MICLSVNVAFRSGTRLFERNQRLCSEVPMVTRQIPCGCAGGGTSPVSFYVVECEGTTYEVRADYVRVTDCNEPELLSYAEDIAYRVGSEPTDMYGNPVEFPESVDQSAIARRLVRIQSTFDLRRPKPYGLQ